MLGWWCKFGVDELGVGDIVVVVRVIVVGVGICVGLGDLT